MIMEHLCRFVESLDACEFRVFACRTGFQGGLGFSREKTASWLRYAPGMVVECEASAAAKFDEHVLGPYLESKRRENDD